VPVILHPKRVAEVGAIVLHTTFLQHSLASAEATILSRYVVRSIARSLQKSSNCNARCELTHLVAYSNIIVSLWMATNIFLQQKTKRTKQHREATNNIEHQIWLMRIVPFQGRTRLAITIDIVYLTVYLTDKKLDFCLINSN
jgi:hypothetical protein